MERINSAGSVVTAVLESTGYFTQAEILESFATFFVSGGAILYFLALVGATASVAMYGSFRMGRYLLIGPGLLFFFVFTRADLQPVVWRIGGDDAKSIERYFAGPLSYYSFSAGEPARVSWFFAWYTHLVSEVTRSISDVILKDEFAQDFLFLTREQGYRLVTESTITDSDTKSIVADGILGQCAPATATLIAISDDRFSPEMLERAIDTLTSNASSVNLGGILTGDYSSLDPILYVLGLISERIELLARLKIEVKTHVNPGQALRAFVRDRTLAYASGQTSMLNYKVRDYKTMASPPFTGSDQEFAEMVDKGNLVLDCQNSWLIAMDAIKLQALQREQEIYKTIFYYWKSSYIDQFALGKPLICEAIIKKLYGGDLNHLIKTPDTFQTLLDSLTSGGCTFADAVALYMLRNTLNSEPTFSDAATRASGTTYSSVMSPGLRYYDNGMRQGMSWSGPGTWSHQGSAGLVMPESLPNSPVGTDGSTCPSGSSCANSVNITSNRQATIGSQRDEAFNNQLSYLARSLMQQVFNYSVQIPYWQGVILYLLAIAYPFFAIVVVLPNRASAFFYLPLAWLWVKSWDVGFALVRVFDQIIWELMPGKSLTYGDIAEKFWEVGEALMCGLDPEFYIPSVLRAILRNGTAADLYQHYFFLSMALFSVPAITGMIILKGRQVTLASFTDAARSFAARTASEEMSSGSSSSGYASSSSAGSTDVYQKALSTASRYSSDSSSLTSGDAPNESPSGAQKRSWTYTPLAGDDAPRDDSQQKSPDIFQPLSGWNDAGEAPVESGNIKKPATNEQREPLFRGLIDKAKERQAERAAEKLGVDYNSKNEKQEVKTQEKGQSVAPKQSIEKAGPKTGFNDK